MHDEIFLNRNMIMFYAVSRIKFPVHVLVSVWYPLCMNTCYIVVLDAA